MIERFARTDEPVLVTGESGTGKELAARAIHDRSLRHEWAFRRGQLCGVPIHPGCLRTVRLREGRLHRRGRADQGADRTRQWRHTVPRRDRRHAGRSSGASAALSAGRPDRPCRRPRGDHVNVRIVAATNVRLRQAIAEGRFREDLYYRLNILAVRMPPLRERPEDILLLAHHALRQAAAHFGREVTGFAPKAMEALRRHDWPGNVRELMAVVRRAVVIGDLPVVMLDDLTGLGEPSAQKRWRRRSGRCRDRRGAHRARWRRWPGRRRTSR